MEFSSKILQLVWKILFFCLNEKIPWQLFDNPLRISCKKSILMKNKIIFLIITYRCCIMIKMIIFDHTIVRKNRNILQFNLLHFFNEIIIKNHWFSTFIRWFHLVIYVLKTIKNIHESQDIFTFFFFFCLFFTFYYIMVKIK